MTITYEEPRTRPPFNRPVPFERGRNYLVAPNYQRAYNYSRWNRGVGKTMRRGADCWQQSEWHPERSLHFRRRAHVWWRRGHRVRRAQWYTQTFLLVSCGAWGEMLYMAPYKYCAIAFHWLMQKHHERRFAAFSKK